MPEPVTFLSVDIDGFRGFCEPQRIDLSGSVVILAGPNGVGKTSVFDALQWLLLGSLERLKPLRARQNTEYIVNAFHGEEPAVVSARLMIGEGEVEIMRRGRRDGGMLEWRDENGSLRGEEAEQRLAGALLPSGDEPTGLRRSLMTSALLQQDVVREVLEDKPTDRYQHLASLLGVDEANGFEIAARRRAERLAGAGESARAGLMRIEAQTRTVRERLQLLRAQQATASDTARVRDEIQERLTAHQDTLRFSFDLPAAGADALLLQANLGDLGDELTRAEAELEQLEARKQLVGQVDASQIEAIAEEVEQAGATSASARQQLQEAETAFETASRNSEALASLATAALPLLGDHCPVCQQEIVQSEVEQHLRELIVASGGGGLPELAAKRQQAREAAEQIAAGEQELKGRLDSLRTQQRAHDQWAAERQQLSVRIQAVSDRAREMGVEILRRTELADLSLSALIATRDALQAAWRAVGDLASVLRALPAGDEIAAAEGELKRLEPAVEEARAQATKASARQEEAGTLQRAATRAAASVADLRFRELAPLIADIYRRLNPHPVFTELDFALGVYRERGEARPIVRDAEDTVEAEPLIVFSELPGKRCSLVSVPRSWLGGWRGRNAICASR